jgi:hypothetical protein
MTTPMSEARDVGRRFSGLVFAAIESPATVDRNALLEAADAFLVAAQGGNPTGLYLGRTMAVCACEWAVWGTAESYVALLRSADMFRAYAAIQEAN